jgi:hypothetical protein
MKRCLSSKLHPHVRWASSWSLIIVPGPRWQLLGFKDWLDFGEWADPTRASQKTAPTLCRPCRTGATTASDGGDSRGLLQAPLTLTVSAYGVRSVDAFYPWVHRCADRFPRHPTLAFETPAGTVKQFRPLCLHPDWSP